MSWTIIVESMTINIYVKFGLQCLIDVGLGLRLSWILNEIHSTSGQIVYLSVLPNIIYLLPKWSIDPK